MAAKSVRTIALPSGAKVPALGQGTWRMAEDARRRKDEIAALRAGLDLGMTLIDTAEMYASGEAEALTAEAIAGRRDEERDQTRHDRGLRAQPEAARDRSH